MGRKNLLVISVLVCLAMALPLVAQDPLSGRWTGDWGPSPTHRNDVTVELKWDGKALTGTVNPGPNAVTLQKTTFDPKSGAVHMEADAKGMRGEPVHYIIDGKVTDNTMSGSWNHGTTKGDFKITKSK
jgi:hypothetical protein